MEPIELIDFWRDAGPKRWFSKGDAFDAEFRARFLEQHLAAARGELDGWASDPSGALALVILLDQFPRNAFRGTPHVYGTDRLARDHAVRAIDAGHDRAVDAPLRAFFYLPFMHSEDPADHERSVELNEPLGGASAEFARHHRDIIRRFGRFPHRNALLGRDSTPDERAFLEEGGFGG